MWITVIWKEKKNFLQKCPLVPCSFMFETCVAIGKNQKTPQKQMLEATKQNHLDLNLRKNRKIRKSSFAILPSCSQHTHLNPISNKNALNMMHVQKQTTLHLRWAMIHVTHRACHAMALSRRQKESAESLIHTTIRDKALLERQATLLAFLRPLSASSRIVFEAVKFDAVKNEGEAASQTLAGLRDRFSRISLFEQHIVNAHVRANEAHSSYVQEFVYRAKTADMGTPDAQWLSHAYFLYFQEQYDELWKGMPHKKGFFMGVAHRWVGMPAETRTQYEKKAARNKVLLELRDPTTKDVLGIQRALKEKLGVHKASILQARRHFVELLEISKRKQD